MREPTMEDLKKEIFNLKNENVAMHRAHANHIRNLEKQIENLKKSMNNLSKKHEILKNKNTELNEDLDVAFGCIKDDLKNKNLELIKIRNELLLFKNQYKENITAYINNARKIWGRINKLSHDVNGLKKYE